MADYRNTRSRPCQFHVLINNKFWARCEKPTDNGFCTEHEKAVCASCKEHATSQCGFLTPQGPCDAHICLKCEHAPYTAQTGVYENLHVTRMRAQEIREKTETVAFGYAITSADST